MSVQTPAPKIVTRFAPSPTGFLHIGGARTALFNYYFTQHMAGLGHDARFRLRIEDTDKARSTDEATQAILDGLDWLGLKFDDEIVYQSQRADAHVAAAHALLENGKAYKCYCTPEELETIRASSETAFRSPWRDKADGPELPFTLRFRVPDGETKITDHVQGEITWQNENFDDLVLLRADGTPTYMLAVVVDDHDMGVTHVVRGDDHLINAGRQTQIYQALGWDVPEWAHVPLIHGPDGKKLSKRHGALGVEAYRNLGYLPDGLRNYLLKLGWSYGDTEFFTDETAAKAFTLDGINSAPARLDFDKMDHINAQHILETNNSDLLAMAEPFFEQANGGPLTPQKQDRVSQAMDSLKPRSKTLLEMATQAEYLLANRPLSITGKKAKPFKNETNLDYLRTLTSRLSVLKDAQWTEDAVQNILTTFAEDHGIGFGKIGQPVRAALTAGAPSPDLSLVLTLLGKDETLGRIEDVLSGASLQTPNA
jgi:glutamyl-tRNA synthetase